MLNARLCLKTVVESLRDSKKTGLGETGPRLKSAFETKLSAGLKGTFRHASSFVSAVCESPRPRSGVLIEWADGAPGAMSAHKIVATDSINGSQAGEVTDTNDETYHFGSLLMNDARTQTDAVSRAERSDSDSESTRQIACPVPNVGSAVDAFHLNSLQSLSDAGCPLAGDMHRRVQFETLLTELSSKFVNVPANQVDSQIESGLRKIVEILGIDRSGLGEVSADKTQFRRDTLIPVARSATVGKAPAAFAVPLVRQDDPTWCCRPLARRSAAGREPSERVLPSNRDEIECRRSP